MNLKLTKKQTADYIQAILTANTNEERKQAHYQYGQLDEVQKIIEVEKELRREEQLESGKDFVIDETFEPQPFVPKEKN